MMSLGLYIYGAPFSFYFGIPTLSFVIQMAIWDLNIKDEINAEYDEKEKGTK